MNEAATKLIVDGFLRGGFDVYEALLGLGFTFNAGDSADAGEADVSGALGTHTVSMEAKIQGGGSVVMLFTPQDATKIVSIKDTREAVESNEVDEATLAALTEIANGLLAEGASNLSERSGETFEIESISVVVRGAGDVGAVLDFVGDGPVLTSFTFAGDPHFDSSGYILHSADLEARIPEGAGADALVSEDEMKDILSGFSPDQETGSYAGSGGKVPENLDVVLGISLSATARLGRVEMPIGDVLNIGPGSIIEVGKLVDDPVELLVNGRLIARGDVVVVDEKFGLRITEIISPEQRIESLG